ncbi:hypothetical protein FNV43_RR12997 [Rhamnella rubrinervis]|uniref:Uncharacterized protein n=1 Tax=Rhamnella rubrinervis TaxID=2594499 RepID=A0A8K0MEH0_9ROSA|nr:hypothetical protein FNV43_RR12997 [Rhamnella rubrinervis]
MPVVGHGVTLRGESSSGSYTSRVSRRGDAPFVSGGRYRDIGLDSDSVRCESEGQRQEVVMFLRRETVMMLNRKGGHYYMPIRRFHQMQEDHFHDMCMWCLDQFDKDPTEQRAMRAHVQARGYGGPPVMVAEPVEDTDEDPEEDSLGTDDYVPCNYMPKLVDQEDFGPWDEPASD